MFARRFLQRAPRAVVSQPRFLSTTAPRFASKDTGDKDSKSGSDDSAAASDAAFNPNKTSPESAEQTASAEGGEDSAEGDPLNVSPGNPEVSKGRPAQEGGAESGVRTKKSGGGSAPKSGGNQSG
jgi:hypothetical protein